MRNLLAASVAVILGLAAVPAHAEMAGTTTGMLSFTTDYLFRGISLSDEQPAIQGAFDWKLESGFYAGLWGSSLNGNKVGSNATSEFRPYVGYTNSFGGFTYDASATYYYFADGDITVGPSEFNADFFELGLGLGYDAGFAAFRAGVDYSPDYRFESGTSLHYSAGFTAPVAGTFAIDGNIGHQNFDDNAFLTIDDYTYYDIGVLAAAGGFDFDLRYSDSDAETFGTGVDLEEGENHLVFTVSRKF